MKRTLAALFALIVLPLAALAGVADRVETVNAVKYKETVANGGTYSVTVQPPDLAASWTLTWPTTGGTNHNTFHTDGSGTGTWSMVALTTDVSGTLPVANGGTGVTASTGSVAVVLSTSPTLVTPVLGVATATSVNKMAITAPATSSTLAVADGKTLTASNTLTFTGTDSSSAAFGAGGTVAYKGTDLSQFAATTSSALAGVISDETGSGALCFATSPTLVTPALGTPASGVATNLTGLPLTSGVTGTLPLANGGTGQTSASTAFGALSPLTTKGDIHVYDTANNRLAVGANGTVLTADSAQTAGVKWGTALSNPMATTGDMIYGAAAGAATNLATGATAGVLHGGNAAVPSWSTVVNADVSSSAAIAGSKLAAISQSAAGVDASSGQRLGTNTNDSASAGNIGEYFENFVSAFNITSVTAGHVFDVDGSASCCTTGNTTGATGITLTAGDWDISGNACFDATTIGAGSALTTVSFWYGTAAGNSSTNRTNGRTYIIDQRAAGGFPLSSGDLWCYALPRYRASLSGSTTYYLKGQNDGSATPGSGGAYKVDGLISARRVR